MLLFQMIMKHSKWTWIILVFLSSNKQLFKLMIAKFHQNRTRFEPRRMLGVERALENFSARTLKSEPVCMLEQETQYWYNVLKLGTNCQKYAKHQKQNPALSTNWKNTFLKKFMKKRKIVIGKTAMHANSEVQFPSQQEKYHHFQGACQPNHL